MRSVIPAGLVLALGLLAAASLRDARQASAALVSPLLPASAPGTSRAELTKAVNDMSARLAANPADANAAVALASAMIRLQRVNNDHRAVITAEQHLRRFLSHRAHHYEARRMLAAVLLSQHRFAEAITEANKAMAADPRDAWNYGAAGDGYMELGDYPRAFDAFDRMGQLQPGPASYARTSYALEVKGDLDGALEYMRRAADGTSPNDPESQAWHFAQIGQLLVQLGRLASARVEFERADATFPGHPAAVAGLARIRMLDGDLKTARLMLQAELAGAATTDLAIAIGDLSAGLGDASTADRYYQMAEQIERAAWSNGIRQPQVLARILSERPGRAAEAVSLAEEAARTRADIATLDTLAWAYYRNGQLAEAWQASRRALGTGTRDARIRCHARTIADALTSAPRESAATRHCLEWRP
jgi:tetratricopeptide (TPR) repeat protein